MDYCKHGHYEEGNPYLPECINELTLGLGLPCWCGHAATDHQEDYVCYPCDEAGDEDAMHEYDEGVW